jgi:hypothetical protein
MDRVVFSLIAAAAATAAARGVRSIFFRAKNGKSAQKRHITGHIYWPTWSKL